MNSYQIKASDAKVLLGNSTFKAAIVEVERMLESRALAADPDNKDMCARIVISKQLLKGIVREIERFIENGEVHDLLELEKKRKSLKERVFQR